MIGPYYTISVLLETGLAGEVLWHFNFLKTVKTSSRKGVLIKQYIHILSEALMAKQKLLI